MLYPKNAHLHSLWYLYEWTLFLCTKDAAAAAAKSLQSCPTLCDPMDTRVMQLLCFFIFLFYFKLLNLKKKILIGTDGPEKFKYSILEGNVIKIN